MLWTDGDFITAADLASLDNEVAQVAAVDGLQIEDSGSAVGVIHRALEEAGDALLLYTRQFAGGFMGDGSVTGAHYAAVMNTGQSSVVTSKILLSQVVVSAAVASQWSPVKRWCVYWALMLFYRDAANRTNNDRYADKSAGYRADLHGMYWSAVRNAGLPVVNNPLPCPGAKYEPDAGTWDATSLSLVPGSGNLTTDWDVAITWVGDGGVESHPSARATLSLTSGNVLRVSIASLMPPDGTQPAAQRALCAVPYSKATGWNVYAGPKNGTLRLQTVTPVPIGTATYTLTANPVTNTRAAGQGQVPNRWMTLQTFLTRG